MDQAKKPHNSEEDPWDDLSIDSNELNRLMDNPISENPNANSIAVFNDDGFDGKAGNSWIYPKNMPERPYQFNIVQSALYNNTLVVLPTGLGKTFIAAVVMYNIYRWYPNSKVLFLAPTRPLVAQQIAACQSIMPFPANQTVELTGKLPRVRRHNLWNTKRVFFATPQVVQSDMKMEPNDTNFKFPYKQVRLLVFDEAHKAKGQYAYTKVAEAVALHNRDFRILALSATPGRTADDVAEVIRNLMISHLEIRFEGSIDVMPYTHKRSIKTIVVPLGEKIKNLCEQLLQIIDPYVRQLVDAEVLNTSLSNLNRNYLLFEQKRFRERNMQNRHPQQTAINTNFSICISLYHALDLLERHGVLVFLNNFEEDEEGRNKFVLTLDKKLQQLVSNLRDEMGTNPFDVSTNKMTNGEIPKIPHNLDYGHPKFEEARECLLEHFSNNKEARAIVFCEYRQSVLLMYRLLLQHAPLLKPRCFVGQNSSGGTLRAFTQKEQIKIMQAFRSGASNVLIATSVGEEGIDVGEVDLIVCFDINTTNPTRFVQRIGRTGRNKAGKVVMLVTEGREHQILRDALAQKDRTNKNLLNSSIVRNSLYKDSPRLVPKTYNPQCVYTLIEPPLNNAESPLNHNVSVRNKSKKMNKKSSTIKASQDLRTFFKKTPILMDAKDREVFQITAGQNSSSASQQKQTEKSIEKIEELFKELDTLNIQPGSQYLQKMNEEKRFRKLNKFLQKNPFVSASERRTDFAGILKSRKLNTDAKLFVLKLQTDIVRDIFDNKQVLDSLKYKDEDEEITTEERDILDTYNTIEEIFGGKNKLQEFLVSEELTSSNHDTFDSENSVDDEYLKKFRSCWNNTFQRLTDLGPCCDNTEYIYNALKQTKRFQIMKEKTVKSASACYDSVVYNNTDLDASFEMNMHMTPHTLKYDIQNTVNEIALMPNKSTPIQRIADSNNKIRTLRNVAQIRCAPLLQILAEDTDNENENNTTASSNEDGFISKIEFDNSLNELVPENKIVKIETKSDSMHHISSHNEWELDEQECVHQDSAKNDVYAEKILDLNIDLNDFLDPFPEEDPKHFENIRVCQKENFTLKKETSKNAVRNENQVNSWPSIKSNPIAIAAHKCNTKFKELQFSELARKCDIENNLFPSSPNKKTRLQSSKRYITSPSVVDIYMNKVRSRSNIKPEVQSTTVKNTKMLQPQKSAPGNISYINKENDESVIIRHPNRASKRRIIESDSESEQAVIVASDDDETDFEPNTINRFQKKRRFERREVKKRCLMSSFIEKEAGVSGSDHSEDEMEYTIGAYLKDSVVVSSDDEENDLKSISHMQGVYLKSLKSPNHGKFKIPSHRIYNDHSRIFSQPVVADECSQYLPDSFVVSSEEEAQKMNDTHDVSICPLEEAERILKERKRAKRLKTAELSTIQKPKRRRIHTISDESDEEVQ